MQTITFYSYKGGVGRTLVVANVAKYLARFGKKVLAIDFDLEAPGLHYKLGFTGPSGSASVSKGLVDYLHSVLVGDGNIDLDDCVIKVDLGKEARKDSGSIHLIPAGQAPSSDYWKALSQINWHDSFYAEGAQGIPFFLELKERIREEFEPDFLLLDSRTGITEIGGIATTLLPDQLVCLLLNNSENLEGAREVLRAIQRTPRLPGQDPIGMVTVLARIPEREDPSEEKALVEQVRDYLNEEAPDLASTLDLSEVTILHSDPELQVHEVLKVDTGHAGSPLLRDYVYLFRQIFPEGMIEPYIDPLIREAREKILDNPEETEKDLLRLADLTHHSEAYRSLIKFHRLAKDYKNIVKSIKVAERYWEETGVSDDPLQASMLDEMTQGEVGVSRDFCEAVWRDTKPIEIRVGIWLIEGWHRANESEKCIKTALYLLEKTKTEEEKQALYKKTADMLSTALNRIESQEMRDQFKSALQELVPT